MIRTDLCDTRKVKGSGFLRKLQRLFRRRCIRFQYEPASEKAAMDVFGSTLHLLR
jgi:hypothetical protein